MIGLFRLVAAMMLKPNVFKKLIINVIHCYFIVEPKATAPHSAEEEVFSDADAIFKGQIDMLGNSIVDAYVTMSTTKETYIGCNRGQNLEFLTLFTKKFYDYRMTDSYFIVEQAHEKHILVKNSRILVVCCQISLW